MRNFRALILIQQITVLMTVFIVAGNLNAQTAMINVPGRSHTTSLNGMWTVILDPAGIGDWRQVWEERQPQRKTDFVEYSFDGGPELQVPGDFNTQMCELTWFEGTVWYKKQFEYALQPGKRLFLHFGAVNYTAVVYLNGEKTGSHEGGFTPFQFEITEKVKAGKNTVIVKVNNNRMGNGLPGNGYDWFNYGGITRDVDLIETSNTYIADYFIQLKKGSLETVLGWVQLNGAGSGQNIKVHIPELGITHNAVTDEKGLAKVEFSSKFQHWSPKTRSYIRLLSNAPRIY
jgi:beta-glucuronidase